MNVSNNYQSYIHNENMISWYKWFLSLRSCHLIRNSRRNIPSGSLGWLIYFHLSLKDNLWVNLHLIHRWYFKWNRNVTNASQYSVIIIWRLDTTIIPYLPFFASYLTNAFFKNTNAFVWNGVIWQQQVVDILIRCS